jgi:hypothetical protein
VDSIEQWHAIADERSAEIVRLRARIAELEAKLETTSERAQWDLDWRIEAEALTRKLDDRIAQAVAELEFWQRAFSVEGGSEHVERALEALR